MNKPPEELNDGWALSTPGKEGMNPKQLTEMVNNIIDDKYENIDSVVIVKNGKLVFEKYFGWYHQGKKHQIRSATKSIGSILTGIAIDKKFISGVNEKIYPYFPEYQPTGGWDSRMKEITIKHLLNMTSGLECDDWKENYKCEREIDSAADWVKYVFDKNVIHQPGEYYAYSTTALVLLGEIIAKASHMPLIDFADKYLFDPLGISDFQWRRKGDVVYLGGSARMRPRDMAKIGYLFLNEGKWKGKQIVSKTWIQESTNRNYEEGPAWNRNKIRHQYLWWFFEDDFNFPQVKGYYASGNGGQHFMVFPSLDLVVAVTGGNYNSRKAKHSMWIVKDHILPSLASLAQQVITKPLNSHQLRDELVGNTFYGSQRAGKYNIYLSPKGTIHGALIIGPSDTGQWHITDTGIFCRTWNVWDKGQERCSFIYQKGELFQFRPVDQEFRDTVKRKKGNPEGY